MTTAPRYFYVIIGRLIQILIVAIQFRLMTTILNESEISKIYILFALQGLISLGLISPVGQYFTRLTRILTYKRIIISNLYLQLFFITICAFIGVVLISSYFLLNNDVFEYHYLTLTILLVVVSSYFQTVNPTINILKHEVVYTNINVLNAVFSLVFSYSLVTQYGSTVEWWIIGQILSMSIFGTLSTVFVARTYPESASLFEGVMSSYQKINTVKLVRFAFPLMASSAAVWFLGAGYRLIIEPDITVSEFAGLVISIALVNQLFSAFENLLLTIQQPKLYSELKLYGTNAAFLRFYSKSLLLTIYFSLCIAFILPIIHQIMVSNQYYKYLNLSYYMIPVEALRVVFNLNLQSFTLKRRTSLLYLPYILSVVNFFVMWKFLESTSATGVLFCLLTSYALGCVTLSCIRFIVLKQRANYGFLETHRIPILTGSIALFFIFYTSPSHTISFLISLIALLVIVPSGFRELRENK